MKLADIPLLVGVFLLGVVALISSVVLQLKNGSAPAEYMNLAVGAMGILGGAFMGVRYAEKGGTPVNPPVFLPPPPPPEPLEQRPLR
jgi:hypothetical protein